MKEKEIRDIKILKKYQNLVDLDFKKYLKNKKNFTYVNHKRWKTEKIIKIFTKKNFDYYECSVSGTIFANPRPKPKILNEFYSKSKSNKFWYEKFYLPKLEARIKNSVVPKVNYLLENKKYLRAKRILDVGCGAGFFLDQLKKNWQSSQLYGLEPSIVMAKEAEKKGHTIFAKSVEQFKKDKYFDLVCCFELFEHLFDPYKFLVKIKNLLKRNGSFYFSTLNGKGFDINLLRENSSAIYPPYHLNFFNPTSIKNLLRNVGFKKIDVFTPGELDLDIVFKNLNLVKNQSCKLILEHLKKKLNEKEYIKVQNEIKIKKMSSHMVIFATK